ncbi:MAG: LytTR family transcriptional regulator [Bacteroidetes bacterium]|nr:LytTR family transcriptional regulator [Bacteroidota bacterium]
MMPFAVLSQLKKWLLQPYPAGGDEHIQWRSALFASLFVTFFLFLFQPFGGHSFDGSNFKWLLECAGFGAMTFIVSAIWAIGVSVCNRIWDEVHWNVWKEILATMVFVSLVGTANLIYAGFRYQQPISWRYALSWQWATWSIGLFPVVFGIFLKQMRAMRQYQKEAAVLNQAVHHLANHNYSAMLRFNASNGKDQIILQANRILHLVAADNYVQIFYEENGQLKQKMLRNTLKDVELQLQPYPQFMRCHRTHLINLDQVETVEGNAQGYRIKLRLVATPIPVSRNLNARIQQLILQK